jgi:hypothetical protein
MIERICPETGSFVGTSPSGSRREVRPVAGHQWGPCQSEPPWVRTTIGSISSSLSTTGACHRGRAGQDHGDSVAVWSMLAVGEAAPLAEGRSALGRTPADEMPQERRTSVACEYVLRDPAGILMAVVRHTLGSRAEVPPHGSNLTSCSVVLNKPENVPALIIGGEERLRFLSPRARVWVTSGTPVGLIRPGAVVASHLRFRTCICGRPRRKCSCHAEEGRLRKFVSGSTRGWRIVDAAGLALGDITQRLYSQPPVRLSGLLKATRGIFSGRPLACEIVESSAHLDWNEHGLFVGLAALCDPDVRRRTFPPNYG